MKRRIFLISVICAFLVMICGCNKQGDVSSQPVSSVPDIVSYIGDSADTEASQQTPDMPDTDSDKEIDSETDTDTSSEADTNTDTDSTEETDSENDTQSDEYTVSAEEVESSLTGYEEEISGTWTAKYILDDSQNEIDGSVIYGTAYYQYGGELTLNSDGTFSVRMGASTDDSSTKGTYTYNGGGQLSMQYYNDSTASFERCSLNGEDAIAMPVDLFGDIYTVYFMR